MSSTDAATSRKLKRLWLSIALAALVVICAPFVQRLMGVPSFPLRIHISSGVVTFVWLVPALWIALSPRSEVTRSMAIIAIAVIVVFFSLLFLWLHSSTFHT